MRELTIRSIATTFAAALAMCFMCRIAVAQESPAPVRLDQNLIAGIGLASVPSGRFDDILVSGVMDIKVATLFDGSEITVSVFESTPAKTDHKTRPFDVDEFVYVLSGKLILTEPNGTAHEYTPGDSLVVPVGYTGTWEMQGNYRELVVLMKKAEE